MGDAYREEFSRLSALAWNGLQNPEVQLPHHKRLFRIWRYPSFEPYVSSMVFVPVERYAKLEAPMVVECKWDRPFDAMRFHDPRKVLVHGLAVAPTMSLREAELLPDELESRIAKLEKIEVRMLIDETLGVDGEEFGFETFGFGAAVSLSWWSKPPAAWQPIVEWLKEIRQFLGAAVERKSTTVNAI